MTNKSLKMNKNKKQKGSVIYYAILILGILFSAGLVVSTVLVQRIALIEEMNYSIRSFYAADAGIEMLLYRWGDFDDDDLGEDEVRWDEELGDNLLEGETFRVRRDEENGELVVVSVGKYGGVARGIEVRREK